MVLLGLMKALPQQDLRAIAWIGPMTSWITRLEITTGSQVTIPAPEQQGISKKEGTVGSSDKNWTETGFDRFGGGGDCMVTNTYYHHPSYWVIYTYYVTSSSPLIVPRSQRPYFTVV